MVSQGEQQSVIVEADDNILPFITTQVRDGRLVVDELRGTLRGSGNLEYRGTPSVVDVSSTGSGSVRRVE
jgi:hypothetical protein